MARIDTHEPLDLEMQWGAVAGDEDHAGAITGPRVAPDKRRWPLAVVVLVALLLSVGSCIAHRSDLSRTSAALADANAKVAAQGGYIDSLEASLTVTAKHVETLSSRVASATAEARFYRERAEEASATIGALRAQQMSRKTAPAHVIQASYHNVEQWRALVAAYFPAEAVSEALLCIQIESGGDPNAVNGDYAGLFQMDSGWGSFDQRTNPEYAIACAASSYRSKGWSAWPPMVARGF